MRTTHRAALLAAILGSIFINQASAQTYTGTWSVQNRKGGTVTLVLTQDAEGKVTGRMSRPGVEYTVEGEVQEGGAAGVMYDASGGVYFQATLAGGQLALTLIEPGPDRQPDFSRTRQLVLAQNPASPGPSAPPPEPSARPAKPSAEGAPLIGQWECQTTEGPARLIFESATRLSYNGSAMAYTGAPGRLTVTGENGPADYSYQLAGEALEIAGPDIRMQCRRATVAEAPAPAGAAGATGLLYGQLCNYSSSSMVVEGGYSTLRVLTFDGQGRFRLGSEVSSSGPSGSAYGSDPGKAGRYQVEAATKGAAVHFTFDNGSTYRGEVHHVYQGRITELTINGNHYGMGLCQ